MDWSQNRNICLMYSVIHLLSSPHAAEFTSEARIPSPARLVKAYNQSAATLNLLRGFSYGGYGGLSRVSKWNLDFMSQTSEGHAYMVSWVGVGVRVWV